MGRCAPLKATRQNNSETPSTYADVDFVEIGCFPAPAAKPRQHARSTNNIFGAHRFAAIARKQSVACMWHSRTFESSVRAQMAQHVCLAMAP
mmetsp:Transcript_88189/g.138139  ORF Transcript_88189/g.138139 Transcript_88189/m.138139 type:complete len:92 (-) Transcript_88189:30-305(-)